MVGFGIIIPVMPFYVLHFGASSIHLGLLMMLYSTMQFLSAPVWGALSDRIGRKPVLLIGLGGFVLSFTFFALATRLWMLFAARALAGLLSSATLPTAMAYISDTTSEESRGGGMGLMGAAMGLGMILGPAVGGLLSKASIQTPFFVAAAMAAANLAAGAALLPESLDPARRAAGRPRGLGPRPSRWQLASGPLAILFVLTFIVSFSMAGLESTYALYLNARLGFGSTEMGLLFMVMGAVGVAAQMSVGRLIRRFGEAAVARFGLAVSLAGVLLITRLWNPVTAAAFASVFSFGNSLVRPSVSSLVSKKTTVGQGTALGTMQSFDSLGRIAGPAWGGLAFYLLRDLPYYTAAAVLAAGLVVTLAGRSLLRPTAAPSAGNDRKNGLGLRG